jgi:hypothetical protein
VQFVQEQRTPGQHVGGGRAQGGGAHAGIIAGPGMLAR